MGIRQRPSAPDGQEADASPIAFYREILNPTQKNFLDFVNADLSYIEENMNNREYILDTAKGYVVHDRNSSYGDPEDNFRQIADYWNVYLDHKYQRSGVGSPIEAADVGALMALMKRARLDHDPTHIDSFADQIGYVACEYDVRAREKYNVSQGDDEDAADYAYEGIGMYDCQGEDAPEPEPKELPKSGKYRTLAGVTVDVEVVETPYNGEPAYASFGYGNAHGFAGNIPISALISMLDVCFLARLLDQGADEDNDADGAVQRIGLTDRVLPTTTPPAIGDVVRWPDHDGYYNFQDICQFRYLGSLEGPLVFSSDWACPYLEIDVVRAEGGAYYRDNHRAKELTRQLRENFEHAPPGDNE